MRIHMLDLRFRDTPGLIAAYLLETGAGLALIETGPGATLPALLEGIAGAGFAPGEVGHIFVTHIHLDHSGAAGWWARQGARIYCHPNAEGHLVDPSRLVESARMVYGEAMDTLWGEVLAAPAGQVTPLQDGEAVTLGEVEIIAWDTPGHARHHHAYVVGGTCFTGDVAGLRLGESGYLSVTAAPPQFDPPAYLQSIQRLLDAEFESLHPTHFGRVTDVRGHLERYRERVREVHLEVRAWVASGRSAEEIRRLFTEAERARALEAGLSEVDWLRHEAANPAGMCADGIRLYVEKNPTA